MRLVRKVIEAEPMIDEDEGEGVLWYGAEERHTGRLLMACCYRDPVKEFVDAQPQTRDLIKMEWIQ